MAGPGSLIRVQPLTFLLLYVIPLHAFTSTYGLHWQNFLPDANASFQHLRTQRRSRRFLALDGIEMAPAVTTTLVPVTTLLASIDNMAMPTATILHPSEFNTLLTSLPTGIVSALSDWNLSVDQEAAEALAGPFFGLSLFPYLAFLYFLSRPENDTPKGVTVGFATCLLFVALTIPAAIAAKILYGVSLADSDWLHGSAESLLTITNLVTVIAFRQALEAKDQNRAQPPSSTSWAPMMWLVAGTTALAAGTALGPALTHATVHTPYLGGVLDLPFGIIERLGAHPEPDNALTIATWVIHISSLVEFLVVMGFCWRWGDVVENPKWKGLTWGLLPLHSSGITACTYHLMYNRLPILVPIQAFLTCVGNTTAAYAALRIALSNGWKPSFLPKFLDDVPPMDDSRVSDVREPIKRESASLVGFEDLGQALAGDNDYTFLLKLFAGCTVASYGIKYGEPFFSFPYDANLLLGLTIIAVPSALNAFKWYKRSQDPTFEGWF